MAQGQEPVKIQNGYSLKPPAPDEAAQKRDAQLKTAAKMYETHFLNEMVKSMRKTVPTGDGLVKRNFAEQIFTEQLDGQYVEGWANRGGIGLSDMIYDQIRERFNDQVGKKTLPAGSLPIAPTKNPHGIKNTELIRMKAIPQESVRGAKLEYRFEVPEVSSDLGAFEAQSPMPGRILESRPLAEGWNLVKLDHGQGLQSELTFPGTVTELGASTEVQSGQKLGSVDPKRPVLAWKLDWT